jgi:hypothetical protein
MRNQVRLSTMLASDGSQCIWNLGGLRSQGPCHDYLVSIKAGKEPLLVGVSTESGRQATTSIQIRDVLFLALGDSFSSGEGNPDVMRSGSSRTADWWDTKCHRSLYSWPVLVAARYAAEHPQNSVTLINRTCSGAVISDLLGSSPSEQTAPLSTGGPGEARLKVGNSTRLFPQIAMAHMDLCPQGGSIDSKSLTSSCPSNLRQPDYVLLSVGGNDVAFSQTLIDALLGKINIGIELDRKRIATLHGGIAMLERQYPKLAKAIFTLFPKTSVLMTLYPDPLHLEPNAFCGRGTSGRLPVRDDGITSVDFTMNGGEEALARLTNFRISNLEVAAIYDDFFLRLNGRVPNPESSSEDSNANPNQTGTKLNSAYNRNEDYRGLRFIGKSLEKQYPGQWKLVSTVETYPLYASPWTDKSKPEWEERDTDQLPCFRTRGYCVRGETVTGRWFNTLDDSIDRLGNPYSAMHPNIYGQLFYASKVYQALPGIKTPKDKPIFADRCGNDCRHRYGCDPNAETVPFAYPGWCSRLD